MTRLIASAKPKTIPGVRYIFRDRPEAKHTLTALRRPKVDEIEIAVEQSRPT